MRVGAAPQRPQNWKRKQVHTHHTASQIRSDGGLILGRPRLCWGPLEEVERLISKADLKVRHPRLWCTELNVQRAESQE